MDKSVEHRRHSRHTAKLTAVAVVNNGVTRLSTTILNLSSSGAMIELVDGSALPQSVTLLYGHSIQPCMVVWQQARRAGVCFDAPSVGVAA